MRGVIMANNNKDLEEELRELKRRVEEVENFKASALDSIYKGYSGYKRLCNTLKGMIEAYQKTHTSELSASIIELSNNIVFMGKNWDDIFEHLVSDKDEKQMYQDDLVQTTQIARVIADTGIIPDTKAMPGEKIV